MKQNNQPVNRLCGQVGERFATLAAFVKALSLHLEEEEKQPR